MDNIPARSAEKGPPSRPPLITPSASPPVSRVWSPKDKPPPSKRPRLSSTPSSSSSAQPPSSSSSAADLRLESSSRLFQFWDQLAGRYNKPLDEDDIVDFRNFKIIKDRGVVRSAASPYSIGSLLDVEADSEDARDDHDAGTAEEEGDDDSGDELDLISPPPSVPVKLEYYKSWYVPPADERDPQDAEAFREFEEAEARRRELYGDVDEEEEEEGQLVGLEGEEDPGIQPHEPDEEERETNLGQDDHERRSSPSPKRTPGRPKSRRPKPVDDESSEDELAAAEVDNTPIPPRQSIPPADDIIDLTDSPPPSPVRAHCGRLPSQPPRMQVGASSRGRSQSKLPIAAKHTKMPERPSSPDQVLQLLTPPRSSSAVESTPDTQLDYSPPLRAETPSPKFPKARPRYTPRPRTPSEDGEHRDGKLPSFDFGERTTTRNPFPVGPPRKAKRKPPYLKPEVVITTSPMKLNGRPTSTRPTSTEPASSPSIAAVKRKGAKGKHKGKEIARPEPYNSPSRSRTSAPRRSQSQPRGSTRESTEESSSPQPRPPSRGTKRRRVSSLSSLSDGSPTKPVTPEPLHTASRSVRKRHNTRSSDRSGYSSDIAPPTSSSVRADDEDEEQPSKLSNSNPSRARSLADPPVPQIPPLYPPAFPPYTPRHHDHDSSASGHHHHSDRGERHTPFPQLPDPQTQYYMAQAWHSLSYLMASGALHPPPLLPAPSYPPGLPLPLSQWTSYTPSHRRHHTIPSHVMGAPSSEAGPSRSTYSTPTHHPHPYPYSYDSRFSSSTLPPSSPVPSSPPSSSPILRPASVAPGQRSRSRGRRVSFKLDANDRPLPLTPPRHHEEQEADSDDEPLSSLQARKRGVGASTSASQGSSSVKGKGKARAEHAHREEEEDECEDDFPRGRPPRARTPGPPSRHEGSVSRSSTKAKASSSTKEPKR